MERYRPHPHTCSHPTLMWREMVGLILLFFLNGNSCWQFMREVKSPLHVSAWEGSCALFPCEYATVRHIGQLINLTWFKDPVYSDSEKKWSGTRVFTHVGGQKEVAESFRNRTQYRGDLIRNCTLLIQDLLVTDRGGYSPMMEDSDDKYLIQPFPHLTVSDAPGPSRGRKTRGEDLSASQTEGVIQSHALCCHEAEATLQGSDLCTSQDHSTWSIISHSTGFSCKSAMTGDVTPEEACGDPARPQCRHSHHPYPSKDTTPQSAKANGRTTAPPPPISPSEEEQEEEEEGGSKSCPPIHVVGCHHHHNHPTESLTGMSNPSRPVRCTAQTRCQHIPPAHYQPPDSIRDLVNALARTECRQTTPSAHELDVLAAQRDSTSALKDLTSACTDLNKNQKALLRETEAEAKRQHGEAKNGRKAVWQLTMQVALTGGDIVLVIDRLTTATSSQAWPGDRPVMADIPTSTSSTASSTPVQPVSGSNPTTPRRLCSRLTRKLEGGIF